MFVGSDALALAPLTRRITYLEEGDWAVVTSREVTIFDRANQPGRARGPRNRASGALIGKGNYRHFMQKEIFEQPAVIGDTLHALINPATRTRASARTAVRARRSRQDDDHRLRHRLPCRAGRQILARTHRPHPGRDRHRLGIPLPRAGDAARTARRSSSRNRARPPTRWRRCAIAARPGAEDHRRRQPAGKLDRARGRYRVADPGRAGDRRRLDQGVHDPARGAGRVHRGAGAGARHDRRRRARRRSPASSPRSRRAPARC